ncbi:MAG: TonB family protein [Muribaculaceae bacterium]|nr:TonB family protein [Muribaculaceae bacterium]
MGQLLSVSLLSSLLLTCMYVTYKWMLSSEKHAAFNRALLLAVYAVSIIIPLAWINRHRFIYGTHAPVMDNIEQLPANITISASQLPLPDTAATNWNNILFAVYLLGMLAVLLHTSVIAFRLMCVIKNGNHTKIASNQTLVLTGNTNISPFSWFRYIVMSENDYNQYGRLIMTHEKRHLDLYHWIDLYVTQLFITFQWYNPAAWLMRDELRNIHEYQADDAVISSGAEIYQYQMLLIKKAVGARFPSLANSLNHSQLKKRVNMMYKTSPSKWSRLRSLALAPAAAVAVLTFSVPAVASLINATSAAELALIQDKVSEKTPIVHAPDSIGSIHSGVNVTDDGEIVHKMAQKMPTFPGGEVELMKTLYYNIIYPSEAITAGKQGTVVVQFVIRSNGKVASPRILRKVDPLLDAEALRVVSALPDFIPGTIDDKPVAVYYTLPIKFSLVTSESTEKDK